MPASGGEDARVKESGSSSYLLGVKIRGLVPLRVLNSKMTSVRGMVVPFKGTEPKNMRGSKCHSTDCWYLLGIKKFRTTPKTEFWYL